ncbi:16S rRNA (cytosine(967)-C(5))-methyltransferase RsmB [Tissierella sp. MSJ-40]|uniref:16S rRNA (cytosine(967)-C(5))-methyltransferase n=1 Tax=Tissierella simiarum TaxID=2841534 RepID=A0ABS6E4C9_9FIRM|nr:16S rRNA (cytosine(967)-C(5))-methyltransferase RsmB [Tissierella simiarum]MBU5437762.1 16S rRNA (cytosine(967)-C(5))-methyltransferase RsmB [Tissierella simiarum]
MSHDAREIAFNILLDINQNGAFSNIAINRHIKSGLNPQDENLIRELVYGVLENKLYIDHMISKVSKIKLKKIHPSIFEILRMGVYQIVFMDKIPDRAAVNECVNIVKKYGHKGTVGFVNGVLRNASRNKEEIIVVDEKNKLDYISIKYSHPKWMVKRWIEEFGEDFTEKLCQANNHKAEINIRVNTIKTTKDILKKTLMSRDYVVRDGLYAKDCLIIDNPYRITDLEEFKLGHFIIQDESSMLVGQIMNPREESLVLDVCSAPGGKSTHIGQIMNNKGSIISRDIYDHKIKLINDNAQRLGINIIKTEVFDGLKKDDSLYNKLDYCLVDAPCSGLGLIRRKPEIKWNRKEEDIKDLSILQYKILENVKDYIKKDGILIYSTCTIEKDENINIVNKFLKENDNFRLISIDNLVENKDEIPTFKKGYLQLFPHIHNTDGFFIAKMIKER